MCSASMHWLILVVVEFYPGVGGWNVELGERIL